MSDDSLESELRTGSDLAIALVDHLAAMGGAGACVIPVVDRATEYVVAVMPRDRWERLDVLPPNAELRHGSEPLPPAIG